MCRPHGEAGEGRTSSSGSGLGLGLGASVAPGCVSCTDIFRGPGRWRWVHSQSPWPCSSLCPPYPQCSHNYTATIKSSAGSCLPSGSGSAAVPPASSWATSIGEHRPGALAPPFTTRCEGHWQQHWRCHRQLGRARARTSSPPMMAHRTMPKLGLVTRRSHWGVRRNRRRRKWVSKPTMKVQLPHSLQHDRCTQGVHKEL
jgi:hypothetical protein